MLTRKDVTGWRHALAELTPATPRTHTARTLPASWPALPVPVASELVDVLASLALAGT